MKMIRVVMLSFNNGLLCRIQHPQLIRRISTSPILSNETDDNRRTNNSFESYDNFERRIFGDGISGSNPRSDAFYQKLDRAEKAHDGSGWGSKLNGWNNSYMDGLDESFDTLSDGMDEELEEAARYFKFNPDEVSQEDYDFRPDMNFPLGSTYDTKDLDLTKPGASKPFQRYEFEVTTEEVLRKADFRNVRFLANFITEAGIIIKRSQTGISAKAQRKVAREIKTARAFGLMPFTTMGTKSFAFGRTMENVDEDFEYYRDVEREDILDAQDPLDA